MNLLFGNYSLGRDVHVDSAEERFSSPEQSFVIYRCGSGAGKLGGGRRLELKLLAQPAFRSGHIGLQIALLGAGGGASGSDLRAPQKVFSLGALLCSTSYSLFWFFPHLLGSHF